MTDATSQQEALSGRPTNSLVFLVGKLDGKMDQVLAALPDLNRRLGVAEDDIVDMKVFQGRVAGALAIIFFITTAWEVIRYVLHLQ